MIHIQFDKYLHNIINVLHIVLRRKELKRVVTFILLGIISLNFVLCAESSAEKVVETFVKDLKSNKLSYDQIKIEDDKDLETFINENKA